MIMEVTISIGFILGLIFCIIFLLWYRNKMKIKGLLEIFKKSYAMLDPNQNIKGVIFISYQGLSKHFRKYGFLLNYNNTFRNLPYDLNRVGRGIGIPLNLDEEALDNYVELLEIVRYSDYEFDQELVSKAKDIFNKLEKSIVYIIVNKDSLIQREVKPNSLCVSNLSSTKTNNLRKIYKQKLKEQHLNKVQVKKQISDYANEVSRLKPATNKGDYSSIKEALDNEDIKDTFSQMNQLLNEKPEIIDDIYIENNIPIYLVECMIMISEFPILTHNLQMNDIKKALNISMVSARIDDRDYVIPDDVRITSKGMILHMAKLNDKGVSLKLEVQDIIHYVFSQVPTPRI